MVPVVMRMVRGELRIRIENSTIIIERQWTFVNFRAARNRRTAGTLLFQFYHSRYLTKIPKIKGT